MVNGLAVLGWGVGGIEAEAVMLGQQISMLLPQVIGFKLTGRLKEGVTATDLVLTVTQMLRKRGVVGKFVEFYGPGLDDMTVADRATIANMAPEYGATCGFFPIDQRTIDYLTTTGRDPERVALVKAYAEAQGMWRTADTPDPVFTDTLHLDMTDVVPSLAGPKRPQDRVTLDTAKTSFLGAMDQEFRQAAQMDKRHRVEGEDFDLGHGDVVIAAITSCTNTSNPSVMLAAGLLARNAVAKGLSTKPWVKTSLAPGSQIVEEYFKKSGLQTDLDKLGFNLVGFGCTTCIGNSGPLQEAISETISGNNLVAVAVLSGNRNFEGRVNPDVRANYLASPPLVVAYALAGSMALDLVKEPLGLGSDGKPGVPQGYLALEQGGPGLHRPHDRQRVVQGAVFGRLQRRHQLEKYRCHQGANLRVGLSFDLCPEPALLRRDDQGADTSDRHHQCAHPRHVPRFDHHGSHLARGIDQGKQSRRALSARPPDPRRRLQSVRHPPRQPSK